MMARHRGMVQAIVATLLFSFVGPVAKLLPFSAGAISFWRALLAGAALVAYLLARRQQLWRVRSRSHALGLLGLGALTAANWYFYILAVQVSTVAVAVVVLFTYPLLTALLEPLFFRERLQGWALISGSVVVLGVLLIVPRFTLTDATAQGALYAFIASVSITLRNLISRKAVRSYAASTVILYQASFAAVVFLPSAAATGRWPTPAEWGVLLLLGAGLTAASQVLFVACLRYLTSSFASLVVSVQPVYTTVIALFLLHEVPGSRTLLGGLLVIGAVVFALVMEQRRR